MYYSGENTPPAPRAASCGALEQRRNTAPGPLPLLLPLACDEMRASQTAHTAMLTLRWRPFGRSWGQFLTPDEQLDIQKEPSNLKTKTEASLCQEDDREILAAGLLGPLSTPAATQSKLLSLSYSRRGAGEQTWEINAEGTTHAAFHPYPLQ